MFSGCPLINPGRPLLPCAVLLKLQAAQMLFLRDAAEVERRVCRALRGDGSAHPAPLCPPETSPGRFQPVLASSAVGPGGITAAVATSLFHHRVWEGERYDGLALRCYTERQGWTDHPTHMIAGPKIAKVPNEPPLPSLRQVFMLQARPAILSYRGLSACLFFFF